MDDESISTADEIAGQEGSISTIENVTQEEEETEEVVPKRDLMRVKDDRDKLKARVRELEAQDRTPKSSSPDLETLKAKYSWVDADFLDDVASLIEKKAEEKLAPVRTQQKQETFEKKWNKLYEDQLAKAEWVDTSKVDPNVIKALALSPQYRDTPIKELIEKLHKVEPTGRMTTESDTRSAMDIVTDVIDLKKPLTKEQYNKLLDDPKALKKYYDAMDWINS